MNGNNGVVHRLPHNCHKQKHQQVNQVHEQQQLLQTPPSSNGTTAKAAVGRSDRCGTWYDHSLFSTKISPLKVICFVLFSSVITVFIIFVIQRILSSFSENIRWEHPPYHFLPRTCTQPTYYTYTNYYNSIAPSDASRENVQPKICITTLTDESNKSNLNKILGWRNFDGIMELTWPNKHRYAQQYNYSIYDESHVVNHTRGPSWFKIIAVLRLLQVERCDWVFWMDADMVIMNSTIRLEDFLPYYRDSNGNGDEVTFQQPNYDLLLSMDLRGSSGGSDSSSSSSNISTVNTDGTTQLINNGTQYSTDNTGVYNAGAWIIRNSEWSVNFLTTWWNMKSYVQPIGHSFSGDNHALKDLLKLEYNTSTFNDHCLVPPRCTFNSFAKFVRPSGLMEMQKRQIIKERTNNEAYYHQTDFVAHVAGVDNKRDTIKMLLELAQ